MEEHLTEHKLKQMIDSKLSRYFGVSPKEATQDQIYKAVVMNVRDIMLEKRQQFHEERKAKRAKRVYYLCMEFLMGRSLKNSLYNLELRETYEKVLKSYGVTLPELYELEPDAGLGNGGLGRLAACFLDGRLPRDGFFYPLRIRAVQAENHRRLADGTSRRMVAGRRSVAYAAYRPRIPREIRRLRRGKVDGARTGNRVSERERGGSHCVRYDGAGVQKQSRFGAEIVACERRAEFRYETFLAG